MNACWWVLLSYNLNVDFEFTIFFLSNTFPHIFWFKTAFQMENVPRYKEYSVRIQSGLR